MPRTGSEDREVVFTMTPPDHVLLPLANRQYGINALYTCSAVTEVYVCPELLVKWEEGGT